MTFVRKRKKPQTLRLSPPPSERAKQLVGFGIVLILVDAFAHAIGFAIQLALVLFGQVAVVLDHVLLLLILQSLFATLQPLCFSGSKSAAFHTIGDAVLLVLFPLVDLVDARMSRIEDPGTRTRSIVLLGNCRCDEDQTTEGEDCKRLADCVRHARLNPCVEV